MCALIETPIIRDMRRTAAELGVVDDLIYVRDHELVRMPEWSRIRFLDALEKLGVDRLIPNRSPLSLVEPDPRD